MSLRVVSVDGHTPVAPADQAAPQLLWVEVDRLRVDDRYQRPLERRNWLAIRKIAEDFRWSRFAPVLVAPLAGGEFALIDGQHRAHAAAMCGFRSVPAMSVLIDRKGQADAFNFVNSATIRIDRYQMFKAALAAGEPWAERCDTVVAAAGCELMTANWSAEQKRAGQVFCTALIRSLVEKGHAKAVTAGLTALKADADGGGAQRASVHLVKRCSVPLDQRTGRGSGVVRPRSSAVPARREPARDCQGRLGAGRDCRVSEGQGKGPEPEGRHREAAGASARSAS